MLFQFNQETRKRIILEVIKTHIVLNYKTTHFEVLEYFLHFGAVISASFSFALDDTRETSFEVQCLPNREKYYTLPSLVAKVGDPINLAKNGIVDLKGVAYKRARPRKTGSAALSGTKSGRIAKATEKKKEKLLGPKANYKTFSSAYSFPIRGESALHERNKQEPKHFV